jgi:hypothetical protein
MALYEPLGQYLKKNGSGHIAMTFREVETVIGRKLPASAYRHRPWWANEERGHSHAKAWLGAGYETEQVDMAGKKLVFRRAAAPDTRSSSALSGMSESDRMFKIEETMEKKPRRSPLWGALKGTFTIEPGWDLTRPALDPEDLDYMEANLDRTADLIDEGLSGKRK